MQEENAPAPSRGPDRKSRDEEDAKPEQVKRTSSVDLGSDSPGAMPFESEKSFENPLKEGEKPVRVGEENL